ncbi:MAG TPA: hypothetical protein V6D14_07745 [Coleofasciculaceae cyanobacterium]
MPAMTAICLTVVLLTQLLCDRSNEPLDPILSIATRTLNPA